MENTIGFNADNQSTTEDFSPLMTENVIERDYTRPTFQGAVDATPIEEPIIIPPSFEDLQAVHEQNVSEDEAQPSDDSGSSSFSSSGANEAMNDLDNKDKKKASQAMVEAVLDGYSQLCGFGNKLVQISPKKIDKLVAEGQINPNLQIPVDGGSIRVVDYFTEYNRSIDGVLRVDDEFKDKVRPVMTRVFMKRNIGMTDEQLLGYYFGVDIIQKGAMIYSLTSQNKQLINSIIELTESNKGNNPQPQAKAEPQRTYSEPEPERQFVEPDAQREYVEPDEIKSKPKDEFQEAVVVEEKPKKTRTTAMPQFGDKDILAQMESIANGGDKPKSTRGRKKKI
jgi:hypothetical protein